MTPATTIIFAIICLIGCFGAIYTLVRINLPKVPIDFNLKSDPLPKNGQRIHITWLPYNNGYPEPNAYIGSKGVVEHANPEDNSFILRYDNGASLIVGIGRYGKQPAYRYEVLEDVSELDEEILIDNCK